MRMRVVGYVRVTSRRVRPPARPDRGPPHRDPRPALGRAPTDRSADGRRPPDVPALDPTAAIAPSADLVAYTRVGGAYRPADLTAALERDRTLYEVRAIIRPTAD